VLPIRTAIAVVVISCAFWISACGGGTVDAPPPPPPPPNPVPSLTALALGSIAAGSAGATITISGSDFISGSVAQWNGSSRTTTFVNNTQLTVAIPASDLTTVGVAQIAVFNPAPGGGTSNSLSFTIGNPAPVMASIAPTSVVLGTPGVTLTVNGSGFITQSEVRWNGSARATTFVSSTQLQANISVTDLANVAPAEVTVFNPGPVGGLSAPTTLTVLQPVPSVTAPSPDSVAAGTAGLTIAISGSNFSTASVAQWNGVDRATTFIDSNQLRVEIPGSDLGAPGATQISVFNPAPGGGTSNLVPFTIGNPIPAVTSISPDSAVMGVPDFTLTVDGSGFVADSVVRWNGGNLSTTFMSSTKLQALIPAADLVDVAPVEVTVFNPAPVGGVSTPATFTITYSVPTLTQVSPNFILSGGPDFSLVVNGTNFSSNSKLYWNGAERPTAFISSVELSATISASDIASQGTAQVTVANPAPGGGTSQPAMVDVGNPVPTLLSVSPNIVPSRGPDFTLVVNGTNFSSNSKLYWNGAERPTAFISSVELSATISAADIASQSTVQVTVSSPAPGGGTSQPVIVDVGNPVPTAVSVSPSFVLSDGPDFTLLVNGTNFSSSSKVLWNGAERPTVFVNEAVLNATISAADIATQSTAEVTVSNPAPGGGTSQPVMMDVRNPFPVLASVSPNFVPPGGSDFTLVANGSNFRSTSKVLWNGAERPTVFINNTLLNATISAADIASQSTAQVTVSNPSPGGGTSNQPRIVDVGNPVPTLVSVSPNLVVPGGGDFTLMVNGSNFRSSSKVLWNGAERPTVFVYNTVLSATISAADIASQGTAQVTVSNPAPAGGTSQPVIVDVTVSSSVQSRQGEWSALFPWPNRSVHATLLPDGRVYFISYYGESTQPYVWDPGSNTFTTTSPSYALFCAGHTPLADGRVILLGGHIADHVGYAHAAIYDPLTNGLVPLPDMNAGRWYPTATTLANGDVLVVGGDIDNGGEVNTLPQVFQMSTQTWRDLSTAQLALPLYPNMMLAPNGNVFAAGPSAQSRYLDPSGTGAWSNVATTKFWPRSRDYGPAVLYGAGKVAIFGGSDPPTATAEIIDLNAATPAWQFTGNMQFARRQHDAVILPDGKILIVGGSSADGFDTETSPVLATEMWDPATGQFTVMANIAVYRGYHSTAVLLTDGRVLSAGGNVGGPNAQIFSPPYLFAGARPTISSAPAAADYGQTVFVGTPDVDSISKVTLVRPTSVTHTNNMNSGFLELGFTKTATGLDVTMPANANLAPPGYYMLFILNGSGVPSLASMVQIPAGTGTINGAERRP